MASPSPLQPNRTCYDGFRTSPPPSHTIASSQFSVKVTCHPLNWMPVSRCRLLKATRFKILRHIILSASTAHLNEDLLSGTELKEKPPRALNVDSILVVSEGICISIASVLCLASLTMHGSQDSRLVMSSTIEPFMPRKADLPVWQTFFLLAALVINSILRARQWQSRGLSRNSGSKLVVADSNMEGRVQKLEEDIAGAVTIIRVLSKQLEKLAVRFRVTRQTLRDPIQETAVLALKTSESVNALAARGDAMEKNLEEAHHVLLRMQENQTKQLELISTLGKLVKERSRNRLVMSNEEGNKNQLGALSQQVGQGRAANESDGSLQSKVAEKRGGSIGKKTASAQRTNIETMEDRLQTRDTPDVHSGPSKPNNNVARDPPRVDFWLNTTQVEDPVGDAKMNRHF